MIDRKARPPIVPTEQLVPAHLDDIAGMIDACDKSFCGLRDKAILLALLDTGARATS